MSLNLEQKRLTPRYQRLALGVAVLFLLVVVFGRAIQREFLVLLIIRSNAPDASIVHGLIDQSGNSTALLQRLWKSQKIAHRFLVMSYLNGVGGSNPDLVTQTSPLLTEAARDVDLSVRELALAVLAAHNHPNLLRLAENQLQDVDPEIRLLGLHYLRTKGDQRLARVVAPFLGDPEPRVAVAAANALRTWTGNDFGVRSHLVVTHEDQNGTQKVEPAKLEAAIQGLQRWKEWWEIHGKDYPSVPVTDVPDRVLAARLPTKDFVLKDLSGKRVRLSDFRGKIVLLNFWTTWCTACWTEIPGLIELQRRRPDVIILGISLDGQPDEHDHSHEGESGNKSNREANVADIREKVQQFVTAKGINYRVLLNPTGGIGARFNGHELPTNVFLDSQGFIRRRFIGGRTRAAFESMIIDAGTDQPKAR
jgi:thiol-disulfide isomerase/thioredoxin